MSLHSAGAPRRIAAREAADAHQEQYGSLSLEEAERQLKTALDKQANLKAFNNAQAELVGKLGIALNASLDSFASDPSTESQALVSSIEERLKTARKAVLTGGKSDAHLSKHIGELEKLIPGLEKEAAQKERARLRPARMKRLEKLKENIRPQVSELLLLLKQVDGLEPGSVNLPALLKLEEFGYE